MGEIIILSTKFCHVMGQLFVGRCSRGDWRWRYVCVSMCVCPCFFEFSKNVCFCVSMTCVLHTVCWVSVYVSLSQLVCGLAPLSKTPPFQIPSNQINVTRKRHRTKTTKENQHTRTRKEHRSNTQPHYVFSVCCACCCLLIVVFCFAAVTERPRPSNNESEGQETRENI